MFKTIVKIFSTTKFEILEQTLSFYHNVSADCARELLKPSRCDKSSRLQWKKLWSFGLWIFCGWLQKWGRF